MTNRISQQTRDELKAALMNAGVSQDHALAQVDLGCHAAEEAMATVERICLTSPTSDILAGSFNVAFTIILAHAKAEQEALNEAVAIFARRRQKGPE